MSFRFEFLDGCRIVMLHGVNPPPAAEWRDYLLQIRRKDVTSLGLLVFTDGGAPDPAQRHELNQLLVGRYFARAIVHDSPLVRGVVAAVSWFAPGVRAFSPSVWPSAALHARIQATEMPTLVRSVRRLHAGMAEPIPWLEAALQSGASTQPQLTFRPPSGRRAEPPKRPSARSAAANLDPSVPPASNEA
jgi:hypothetical protein